MEAQEGLASIRSVASTSNEYDGSGRLFKYTDPENGVAAKTEYTYEADGDLDTVKDPKGNVTSFDYDADHRVTSITHANPGSGSPTYGFVYTPGSAFDTRKTDVTDARGNLTTHRWDNLGRVHKTIDALGSATSKSYTSNSNVVNFYDTGLKRMQFSFNAANDLTQVKLPTGATTTFGYGDTANNPHFPTSDKDPLDNEVTYEYDSKGNLRFVRQPQLYGTSNWFEYTYTTDKGLLDTIIDGRSNTWDFGYDAYGNLTLIDSPGPIGNVTFT